MPNWHPRTSHADDLLLEAKGRPVETTATPQQSDTGTADKQINQVIERVIQPNLPGPSSRTAPG